ncbi:hypothetical protein FHL15_009895 [Xylaria flabelliformis]|uniref:Mid2 domain-containing protein n=1 Tax=Xylaria flabelliformis TaxID=2512241 RepID=A0A553HMP5_9PEZI|nr:hypothetical protein FHL15_009895 [Xylaria flabelliformis]
MLRAKSVKMSSISVLTCLLADVFLVNCRGSNGSQSEAAYYPDAPTASPETIAVVTSPDEGLRRWEENTTTAIFQDAGSDHQTGFTVTLGKRPLDGEIAGNASNTWNSPFLCYAQASRFLYTHEQRNCSSAYDCSRAGESPAPIAHDGTHSRTFLTPLTQIPIPSDTDTASQSSPDTSHPQAKVAIGVGVGVTLGTIILAVTILSFLRKYWNQRRLPGNSSDVTSNTDSKVPQLDGGNIYEAGSKAIPAELPGCNEHIHELEAKPRAVKPPEYQTAI